MTKLPDNETLRRFYRESLSDKEIAAAYDVSIQAVNKRLNQIGIERKPWMNTATAVMDAAWPTSKDFKRSEYTHLNRARNLFSFMRWRLGDPTLSERQMLEARQFADYARRNDVVLSLDPDAEQPWVWLPREPADGQMVLRWPADREGPKGHHLKAVTLPEGESDGSGALAAGE